MEVEQEKSPFRGLRVVVALVAILALAVVAGCGSDDDDGEGDSEAAQVAISVSEGKDGPTLTVPDSLEAGVAEITLTNEGESPHSAQLLRSEDEHDEGEVIKGFEQAASGKPIPDWLFAAGGTGTVAPGESVTVTQVIEPDSTYWVADDESSVPVLEELGTTGSEAGETELPVTGNVVKAVDFDFEADELTAGEPITFENTGEQPHHMIAAPIAEGKTIEDVEKFIQDEKGQPPVDLRNGQSTSVLEGGTSQVSGAELEPGSYALLCFISNREGGPPHVAMGMVQEVEVAG